jgi:hypothetical protein
MLAQTTPFMTSPEKFSLESEQADITADWLQQLSSVSRDGLARWESPNKRQLSYGPRSDELVCFSVTADRVKVTDALALVEPLPFELCSFGAAFFDEWIAADYERWGFARSHISFGWGCAFRGAGHDRLMSRRWLDFGPWRVIRRTNDTTLVQFHDLDLTDPAEAYEQAKAGHERMSDGFLHHNYPDFMESVRGLYVPERHRLEIVVPPGTTVDAENMYSAAAVRLYFHANPNAGHNSKPGSIGPTKAVAYVFLDEAQARAHLHDLWLRELECWLVDDKGKRRLDLDYHPVPDPPAWVKRLEAAEARQEASPS